MKQPGHLVQMEEGRLPKRAEAVKQPGCSKRVRPQLRWEDCVKRDVRKTKDNKKWKEKATDREQWKRKTAKTVQQKKN